MYKELIKAELLRAKNGVSDLDKTPLALREMLSDKEAEIIVKYIKQILLEVVSAGIPVPQDGGTGFKTTMLAKINTI